MKVSFVYSNRAEYSILKPYIQFFKSKTETYEINLSDKIQKIHQDKNLYKIYKLCYEEFSSKKIDYVIVLGDRRELPFIAIAAMFLEIKLVHIGAGEYLEGLTTYDQIMRPIISILSNYQICFSQKAKNEVEKLFHGISYLKSNAHNYGNPVFSEIDIKKLKRPIKEKFDLVLLHPQSLSKENTKEDIKVIKKYIKQKKTIFIKGNKDKNYEILERFYKEIQPKKMYKFYDTLPKEKYFSFVKYCDKYYTNSSSISEIKLLNKNCLVVIGKRNKNRSEMKLKENGPKLLYDMIIMKEGDKTSPKKSID